MLNDIVEYSETRLTQMICKIVTECRLKKGDAERQAAKRKKDKTNDLSRSALHYKKSTSKTGCDKSFFRVSVWDCFWGRVWVQCLRPVPDPARLVPRHARARPGSAGPTRR